VGSAAAKMAEMAAYLHHRGHQVEVVSQIPCYPQGVVYPGYQGARFRRESRDGVRVRRTWSYASPERDRFQPRLANYLSFMGTALAGILAGPRPDLMLVYSPPLFLGLTAAAARAVWGCPFIFWVNGSVAPGALSLEFMQEGPLYRLACAMESFIYRRAARIFVYSREMLEEVVGEGGPTGPGWIVIPCGLIPGSFIQTPRALSKYGGTTAGRANLWCSMGGIWVWPRGWTFS